MTIREARTDDGEDICSDPFEEGCTASLNDGEGWNGACGNCADRLENEAETQQEQRDDTGSVEQQR